MNNKPEDNIIEELAVKRKEIKTFEDLTVFLKDIEEHYNTGYGEAPRAIAQASVAVGEYLSSKFGITRFQAGFVMWDFIKYWMFLYNACGLKLVDYDEMLYPQYDYKFEKTISQSTWENIQEQAKKFLDIKYDYGFVSQNVIKHWKSIAAGKVPFGYTVIDD